RLAVGPPGHRQAEVPALTPDHTPDRRPVVVPGAVAGDLVRPTPRRALGVQVRDAFFPPHPGRPRRPPAPCRPAATSRGSRTPGLATGASSSTARSGRTPARGPVAPWGRPGRTRG